jgi:hypothetical protein
MIRVLPVAAAAVIASGIAATAAGDPIAFWQTNGRAPVPLDIRPGGALPASSAFIRGRLKCARNVNAMLRANGYRGTGSDMARSFLSYGVAVSGPRPGVIQIERRGWNPAAGHVQVVDHKRNGVWMCRNPSSRVGQWVLQPCANSRVIAYRMPTAADILPTQFAAAPVQPSRTVSAYAPPQGLFGAAILPAGFVPTSLAVRP